MSNSSARVPVFSNDIRVQMNIGPTMKAYLAVAMSEDGASRQGVFMRDIVAEVLAKRFGVTKQEILCDTAVRAYNQIDNTLTYRKDTDRPV